MLEIYFKNPKELEFKKIDEFRAGSWILVKEATIEDLTKIAEVTGIDLNDFRDSLDKYELPRIEQMEGNVIFFTRHPSNHEFGLYTETLTLIMTPSFVIAISPYKCEIIDTLLNASTPIKEKPKLILHILLKITQEYTNSIKRVRYSILGVEQMPRTVDNNAITILTQNEEILNQYLTALVPMRNLLETLASGRSIAFYEGDLDQLEDLMIAMHQSEDVCRVNIKSIRSLRDSYQIMFTNDVNRTIKLLTAVTIIVTIPTIIASIYGMNVALPSQHRPYAFWFIMALIIVISIIATLLFRKNRWL